MSPPTGSQSLARFAQCPLLQNLTTGVLTRSFHARGLDFTGSQRRLERLQIRAKRSSWNRGSRLRSGPDRSGERQTGGYVVGVVRRLVRGSMTIARSHNLHRKDHAERRYDAPMDEHAPAHWPRLGVDVRSRLHGHPRVWTVSEEERGPLDDRYSCSRSSAMPRTPVHDHDAPHCPGVDPTGRRRW